MLQLTKIEQGENLVITKEGEELNSITVGLGWDVPNESPTIDVDVYAVAVDENDKALGPLEFVYFGAKKNAEGKLSNPNSSVVHSGDNRTGAGEGDDESIVIDLTNLPVGTKGIIIGAFIYDAAAKGDQKFGKVKNAYARVVDTAKNTEIVRYDLTEDFSAANAIRVGKVYSHATGWKFKAVGEGAKLGIGEIIASFGI